MGFLVEARRQCTSRGLPFSISDSWRTLVMRIAMDAAIADAAALERSDGHDGAADGRHRLPAPRGAMVSRFSIVGCRLQNALLAITLTVKGSWLRTQTISVLALLDPSAAIHSGGFISTDELRRSHKGKPGDDAGDDVLPILLIALRDLWVPPGGVSTTTSGVDLVCTLTHRMPRSPSWSLCSCKLWTRSSRSVTDRQLKSLIERRVCKKPLSGRSGCADLPRSV